MRAGSRSGGRDVRVLRAAADKEIADEALNAA
jgi:hypothetical protein